MEPHAAVPALGSGVLVAERVVAEDPGSERPVLRAPALGDPVWPDVEFGRADLLGDLRHHADEFVGVRQKVAARDRGFSQ